LKKTGKKRLIFKQFTVDLFLLKIIKKLYISKLYTNESEIRSCEN